MAKTSELLTDFTSDWGDFDKVYELLDDPDIGFALVREPTDKAKATDVLANLAVIGAQQSDEVEWIQLTKPSPASSVELTAFAWNAGSNTEVNTKLPIESALQKAALDALETSLTLRCEVVSRLVQHCSPEASQMLSPFTNRASHFQLDMRTDNTTDIQGVSRIDSHNYALNAIAHQRFRDRPHRDDTIFTEHGGSTTPGLQIVLPGEKRLTPYDVPSGYRLLSRGTVWPLLRTPDHLGTLHSAASIDQSVNRERWVILWRAMGAEALVKSTEPAKIAVINTAHSEDFKEVRDGSLKQTN